MPGKRENVAGITVSAETQGTEEDEERNKDDMRYSEYKIDVKQGMEAETGMA